MISLPWLSDEEEMRPRADDRGLLEAAPAAARRAAADAPPHKKRRWLFNGSVPEPVPSHLGAVEAPEPGKVGICCSGGGIRSAAFSLGALQALQEEDKLRQASYLAAVSGGSYIAAAISMVAKTGPRDSDEKLLERKGPFAPGSPEEQYLRNRCSYLAPTLADRVYIGLRIVLGLLVNLVFLSMALAGVALVLTGFLYVPLLPGLAGSASATASYEANLPTWFWVAPATLAGAGLAAALATMLFRWRKDEWMRFFTTWTTRLLLAAAALALVLIGIPHLAEWLRELGDAGNSASSVVDAEPHLLGAGTIALIAGVIAQLGHMLTSMRPLEEMKTARKALSKIGSGLRLAIAYLAAALVGPLLLLTVVGLTVAAGLSEAPKDGQVATGLVLVGLALLGAFAVLYHFADLTSWSLHPFYKRRLSTAFALKRVSGDRRDEAERERFEALPPADPKTYAGIAVERDYDELVPLSKTALKETAADREWPTLLVCAAANISNSGASPPGRPVTSFTFSANTVGGPLVGAVKTPELEQAFESPEEAAATEKARRVGTKGLAPKLKALRKSGARKHRRSDMTLPAAVAMSGAAISPSMGKMTKRPLTFLMALANFRLGVWLPNPRWVTEAGDTGHLSRWFARPRPSYLIRELFGLNSIDAKYLYVTDGGHYENLGLVELLRRGCTEIYCLDASGVGRGGGEFEALGDAIALARDELSVEIVFDGREGGDPEELVPEEKSKAAKRDVVTATIAYPETEDGPGPRGKLVYVRNTVTPQSPWDAKAHQQSDPRFPNNPTVDQLYTDQKFEAYRVLGAQAGAHAVAAMESI
ncbi:MAG TPA: patatin-like phospholipase family protein [Solirubrobacterales bacterium]|jgi:hypothetical protein